MEFGSRPQPWMIWYAIVLHLWWGTTLLLLGPQGSDWHGGVFWNVYVESGGTIFWGYAMVIASLLSISGCFLKPGTISLCLMLPQQAILTIGAIGVFMGLAGYLYPFETSRLLRVFPSSVGAFVFHTLALIDLHAPNFWQEVWKLFRRN